MLRGVPGSITKSLFFAFILIASASNLRAQFPDDDADGDGLVVPKFLVPGGSVSVENGGQGVVVVPIAVPPGVNDAAPQLQLRYASGASDDGLGVGWSLDLGFPDAIRRSPRLGVPKYQDTDLFTFAGVEGQRHPVDGDHARHQHERHGRSNQRHDGPYQLRDEPEPVQPDPVADD